MGEWILPKSNGQQPRLLQWGLVRLHGALPSATALGYHWGYRCVPRMESFDVNRCRHQLVERSRTLLVHVAQSFRQHFTTPLSQQINITLSVSSCPAVHAPQSADSLTCPSHRWTAEYSASHPQCRQLGAPSSNR